MEAGDIDNMGRNSLTYSREYYKQNQERLRVEGRARYWNDINRTRTSRRDRKYNLSVEDYDKLLIEQNGVCAICKESETANGSNGKLKPLSVDHNHETKKVRGLLCHNCNMAIGNLKESCERAKSLIEYLERNK